MLKDCIKLNDINLDIYSVNTVVVGTGAAGFNAADRIYSLGQKDVAIVTEGINMGTSRNTGSDKQTYYKLTLSGEEQDSVYEMAKTLFDGGSMDGDIALTEAALSPQCFYKLIDIGVPFPHNTYGEYVGYKTDHDPRQRATSVGPLTSKFMTEKLQDQVIDKNIPIFNGYQVIGILKDEYKEEVVGLLTLNTLEIKKEDKRYVLFNCTNIVYATGGPAGIYKDSVYPESQTGASGIAFESGIKGKNLGESQYGIASIDFRWNLSGTYQQVLPRYFSTDKDGNDEREFLDEYFSSTGKMLDAIFLKGYQWPFDPKKIENEGSSLIDLLVYNETKIKGRRVFLDFLNNPTNSETNGELDFSLLGEESYNYLANSKALFGKPIDRLRHMNQPAIKLYKDNGIDLEKEPLEIAVCAQHNNGGLAGDLWWESNLKGFFPVGEVNGTHGIYRPGGSALNSGQVGSLRAAQYITNQRKDSPLKTEDFMAKSKNQIINILKIGKDFEKNIGDTSNILDLRNKMGNLMSENGGIIRDLEKISDTITKLKENIENVANIHKLSSINELPFAFQNRDIFITQLVYLSAIKDYIEKGGKSRGSYLIVDRNGDINIEAFKGKIKFTLDDGKLKDLIQETEYKDKNIKCSWRSVNPIPEEDNWFEKVWYDYRNNKIII
ncbi:MAG TPA: FAD-binding protein [Tissierellales bacterium]|nr:FAD-binding protein [Tissierellales bacterium]